MNNVYIEKDLTWEDQITDNITYIPLAGASEISNFRSPDSYVFIFFEKCEGIHSIDFLEYQEANHQIHISFPGQIHSWKTKEGSLGHKLIVSRKFAEVNLFGTKFSSQHVNNHPIVNLNLDQFNKLRNEFILIRQEIEDQKVHRKIVSLRAQLIIHLINQMMDEQNLDEADKTRIHPIISTFYSLLEAHFPESKSVHFYADKLALTPNYLNILVKTELGKTAKDIIDSRVVLEAKRRLLGTGQSIKQIALDLGFQSISSFSAYIFRKTGFYPKKFREGGI
ncbi:helix-turn-helix domain-containing protein [Chryseobacterium sp. NRRL B-14859]|uniref:AraC family transcriptional regulator n=1 Tax=Chryseobacterium sp. NRRL B-14859 TaxID=1562763 RepID=UPI00339A4CBB